MNEKKTHFTVFILFSIISFSLLFFHELWRDELHTLIVINESNSFIDVFKNTRYDGHPLLWYYIVYAFKGASLFSYQIVHWLISIFGIGVFYFYSRIDIKWKTLIIFGYFFTYEYNIIFRNYSLGILFLFLSVFAYEKKRFSWIVLSLSLAFQANFFSLLIGIFFWLYILINHFKLKELRFYIYSTILFFGFLLYVVSALFLAKDHYIPNADLHFNIGTLSDFFKTFGMAFINIPEINIHFWNSYFLNPTGQFIIGIISYFLVLTHLIKFKRTFLFFLITTLTIQLFFGVKYYGYLRHFGHLYIVFIITLWLNSIEYKKIDYNFNTNKIVLFIFLTQIYASIIAYYYDFNYKFSDSQAISSFIEKNNKKTLYYPDYAAAPISFYTAQRVFCLDMNKSMSYMKMTKDRIDRYGYLHLVDNYHKNNHFLDDKYLITNELIPLDIQSKLKLKLIKSSEKCINIDEQYYCYTNL